MLLQLCVVNDGDNVVNKTLTNVLELNINLKKDFDIINPVMLLSGSSFSDFTGFNYCVIPDLGKHYFINSVTQVNSKVAKLDCVCDVLETYKDSVLNSKVRFYRNIKTGDYYDGDLNMSNKQTITKYSSNVTLEEHSNIVMVTVKG